MALGKKLEQCTNHANANLVEPSDYLSRSLADAQYRPFDQCFP